MVKLTGLKKVKTSVFISGNGSNLKNLIKFSKLHKYDLTNLDLKKFLKIIIKEHHYKKDSYEIDGI